MRNKIAGFALGILGIFSPAAATHGVGDLEHATHVDSDLFAVRKPNPGRLDLRAVDRMVLAAVVNRASTTDARTTDQVSLSRSSRHNGREILSRPL